MGVPSEILVPLEVAADDLTQCVSIALVDPDAPFSRFKRLDWCPLALSAQGLHLVDEGQLVQLAAFEAHSFAGDMASHRRTPLGRPSV